MFAKLSALALLVPFVNALTLNIPQDPKSASPVTITWTKEPSDDVFSLYLFNQIFHNSFAIANNVNPADQTITLTLPTVPAGDGYTLAAVNITDINDVYAQTAAFNIAESPSTSVTSSSTSASSSASGSASGSVTASASGSGASTTAISSSTSRFGVTVSNTASSSGASGSGSGSASSSAASASASNSNGAPASLIGAGANQLAALALAVVAGGAAML